MALTIKNPETIDLAQDLARRLNTTQTGAITLALRQALSHEQSARAANAARADEILQQIWHTTSPRDAERIRRNLNDLYDERGLPA